MKVLLFGASGMVGQGVLRECLLDSEVTPNLQMPFTVMGAAENALLKLVPAPVLVLWRMLRPDGLTTSERVGKAMLAVARRGAPSPWSEIADINRLGA